MYSGGVVPPKNRLSSRESRSRIIYPRIIIYYCGLRGYTSNTKMIPVRRSIINNFSLDGKSDFRVTVYCRRYNAYYCMLRYVLLIFFKRPFPFVHVHNIQVRLCRTRHGGFGSRDRGAVLIVGNNRLGMVSRNVREAGEKIEKNIIIITIT